jgi:DNA-binding PadR family transcriptional regulator
MIDAKQAALHRVLAAIAVLGQAETRDIATQAGMAYSTLTPKLRALESDGLAERVTEAGTSRWQLTASGVLAAAVTSDATEADDTLPLDTETERPDVADTETGHPQTQDTDIGAGTEDADIDEDGPEGAADAVQIAAADADRAAEAEPIGEAPPRRAEADDTADDPDADGESQPVAELTGAAADPGLDAEGTAAVARPDATPDNTDETAADRGAQDEPADAPATDRDTAAVPEAGDAVSAASAAEAEDTTAKPRRRGGTLREAALAALRKLGPSKVGAVCKAIDEANEGTGAAKASPGAVRNALDKLTEDGHAALVAEKPAAFDAV